MGSSASATITDHYTNVVTFSVSHSETDSKSAAPSAPWYVCALLMPIRPSYLSPQPRRPPSARRAPHARPRAGVKRRSARTHGPSAGGGRGAPERPSAWLGASAMSSGNPGAAVIRAAPVYITCQAQRGCLSKQRAVAPRRVGVKGSAAWPRTGAARPGAAQASPARQQGVLDGFPSPAAPEGQPCACAP